MSKDKALRHLMDPFYWVHLSPRQAQAIKQACRGKTAGAIAADMGVSEVAVKSYLRNALIKINLTDHSNLSLRDLPGKQQDKVIEELRS
jgi:DNA-binding CsgD family transcriptional regulator